MDQKFQYVQIHTGQFDEVNLKLKRPATALAPSA